MAEYLGVWFDLEQRSSTDMSTTTRTNRAVSPASATGRLTSEARNLINSKARSSQENEDRIGADRVN